MRTVLITGATGFLGRPCVEELLRQGWRIRSVSRQGGGNEGCAVDLLDPGETSALVAATRPSHLLHLAWVTTPGVYWTSPENSRWVEASLHLVREFLRLGGRRLVLVGSCAEYDWEGGVCSEERTAVRPATLYGACKDEFHQRAAAAARQVGASLAWARLFYLYGPGEDPRRLVASVIRSLLRGEPAACSSGTQRRDFLHVGDAARALAAILGSSWAGAVNVASGRAVSVRNLVRRIGMAMGTPDLVQLGARPAPEEHPLVVGDITRLRQVIGWEPLFDLRRGIADTIDWYRRQERLETGCQETHSRMRRPVACPQLPEPEHCEPRSVMDRPAQTE